MMTVGIPAVITTPLLRHASLLALRWGLLHSPSHWRLRLHSLGGYGGGGLRPQTQVDLIYYVAVAAKEQ
jgi:hypothetical protein